MMNRRSRSEIVGQVENIICDPCLDILRLSRVSLLPAAPSCICIDTHVGQSLADRETGKQAADGVGA
jgi:hypothetical protein